MKDFLVGLAIGVPTGMLLGDHREGIAEWFRNALRQDVRGVSGADGSGVAEAVNRVAEDSRERAGSRNESSMQARRRG